MNSKRIAYLDVIKAYSILLVVFCHITMLSDETVIGNAVMSLAWAAVPCFMMVSGGCFITLLIFPGKNIFETEAYLLCFGWLEDDLLSGGKLRKNSCRNSGVVADYLYIEKGSSCPTLSSINRNCFL